MDTKEIKICTSIKQSQKLVKLGINITISDMYYSYDYNINEYEDDAQIIPQSELGQHFSLFPEDIPAWSLTALLELTPAGTILLRDKSNGKYKCISTIDSYYYDNPLDAVFDIIVWLKEIY